MDVMYCKTGDGLWNILIQSESGNLFTSNDDGFSFRDRLDDLKKAGIRKFGDDFKKVISIYHGFTLLGR